MELLLLILTYVLLKISTEMSSLIVSNTEENKLNFTHFVVNHSQKLIFEMFELAIIINSGVKFNTYAEYFNLIIN